jgi:hypothetical protein
VINGIIIFEYQSPNTWSITLVERIYKRKRPQLAGGYCPQCGKALIYRTNRETHEKFIGCSGYPDCEYTLHLEKSKIDYVGESFPNGWKPNYSSEVAIVIKKCKSRPEIKYLFGAAYYLDFGCGLSNKPLGITLSKNEIVYGGKQYDAIRFDEPYQYWGGGTAPSAMAFIPQLEFAKKYRHDFGIFFASDHAASKSDWWLELAVEIDFHPDHFLFPTNDKNRDSLVNYQILRLQPKIDEPTNWFSKVRSIWNAKNQDS